MARKPISRVDLTKIADRYFKNAKRERSGPAVQIGPLKASDLEELGSSVSDPRSIYE